MNARKKNRFTLIELLVVIAIIAILASLLLPTLNQAKGKGKQALCAGNIRQVAMAFQFYSDDYDNMLLNLTNRYEVWMGCAKTSSWYEILSEQQMADPAIVNGCPDVETPASWFKGGKTTYGGVYTHVIGCCCPGAWATENDDFNNRMTKFSFPERSALVMDSQFKPSQPFRSTNTVLCRVCEDTGNMFSTRHSGGSEVAYADGHVSWSTYKGLLSKTKAGDEIWGHWPDQ